MAAGKRVGPVNGFALAEVLVAAFILAVGILGLASLQVAAVAAAEAARARMVAVAVARNALEGVPGGNAGAAFDREGRAAVSGSGCFTVKVVRQAPVGPAGRYRVEVAWPGGRSGQPRRVVLTRLAAP